MNHTSPFGPMAGPVAAPRLRVMAYEVTCPECGAGLADVAPDYELTPHAHFVSVPPVACTTRCTCRGGHVLLVHATRDSINIRRLEE